MPHVASETQSHAVKYSQPRAATAPASERSPNGAFESMLDDNATAAADRAAPRAEDGKASRTAPSQKAAPPAKAKESKSADRADEAPPADKPKETKETKETEAKADTTEAAAETADKPAGDGKDATDKTAAVDTATAAPPAAASQPAVIDPAALFAIVEAAVTPAAVQPQAETEAEADTQPAAAAAPALPAAPAIETAAVVEETALPVAAKATKAAEATQAAPDFAKLQANGAKEANEAKEAKEVKEVKADGDADDEQKTDDALAAKAAKATKLQDEAKPMHAATTDADKEQIAQARGEEPAHAHRGHADAAPAVQADVSAQAPKAPDNVAPQLLPSQAHALHNPTAAAATAAAPAQPLQQEPAVPLNGVAVEIVSKATAGKNHFEIRLDPPELGRIDVRLDVDRNGNVTSRLIVDRQDTLDLLRRDAAGLERALQDAGLKTSDNGLQFSLRDQAASQQERQMSGEQARLVVDDEALPVLDVTAQNYGRLAGRAGGLDIRV